MYNKEWFYGRAVDDNEAKAERHELRKIIGILAVVGVLVGLFLGIGGCAGAAATQAADNPTVEHSLVFRGTSPTGSPVALRIFTEKPCTDDTVRLFLVHRFEVPPEMLPLFKSSVLTWKGRDWASCWIEQQGYVMSVDEEGAPFQPVPMSAMREEGV